MADISQININNTTYDVKDTTARQVLNNLPSNIFIRDSENTLNQINFKNSISHTGMNRWNNKISAFTVFDENNSKYTLILSNQ